jgi:hypothetical protein
MRSYINDFERNQTVKTMVPRVGLEPTLRKEPDFESGASTNSAIEALKAYHFRPERRACCGFAMLMYEKYIPRGSP